MMQHAIWTEKYRPKTLADVIGHETAVARLEKWLEADLGDGSGGGLAHSLFAGPPGVGKTAMLTAYAHELYGDDWRANLREFNASDDRGIDVVRDDIKEWCRTNPAGDAPYKIVFLDEADQLTKDAQAVLRRVMEQFADTTRFVLSCNYPNQIIDPVQSRCAMFYISRLKESAMLEVVETVVYGEDIDADNAAIDAVVQAADGDARRAINTIQMSVTDGELRADHVRSVTGVVDDQLVFEICRQALRGELDEAMTRFDVELLKQGANYQLLVKAMFRAIRRLDLPPDARVKCIDLLATTDERLRSGLNPHVQFHNLLGHIHMTPALSVYAQQGGDA